MSRKYTITSKVKVVILGANNGWHQNLMAQMIDSLKSVAPSIQLSYEKEQDRLYVEEKVHQFSLSFSNLKSDKLHWIDMVKGTEKNIRSVAFQVKLGEHLIIKCTCTNIPNAYLSGDTSKAQKLVNDSDVIMVTVNAPLLYECKNSQLATLNNYEAITNIVLNSNYTKDKHRNQLMFVVTDSEKYVRTNEMSTVNYHLKSKYQKMIDKVKMECRYDTQIIPVLRFSNLEFNKFYTAADGSDIKMLYSLIGNVYYPQWCEQPMLAIIQNVLKNGFNRDACLPAHKKIIKKIVDDI